MNRTSIRLFLLTAPAVLVVTWGFLSRATTLPFSMALATVFAALLAFGTAARQTVQTRTLIGAAALGGVVSVFVGLPLAIFAMIAIGPNVGDVAISYTGWEGVPPVLVWSIMAMVMAVSSALLCVTAVLLGRWLRVKLIRSMPNDADIA